MRIPLVFICALWLACPVQREVMVKQGVVRDWNGVPVVDARVQAPRGSFVTASKDDVYKRMEVTTDELVIVVDQMPL